jgi:hypothetical protein
VDVVVVVDAVVAVVVVAVGEAEVVVCFSSYEYLLFL